MVSIIKLPRDFHLYHYEHFIFHISSTDVHISQHDTTDTHFEAHRRKLVWSGFRVEAEKRCLLTLLPLFFQFSKIISRLWGWKTNKPIKPSLQLILFQYIFLSFRPLACHEAFPLFSLRLCLSSGILALVWIRPLFSQLLLLLRMESKILSGSLQPLSRSEFSSTDRPLETLHCSLHPITVLDTHSLAHKPRTELTKPDPPLFFYFLSLPTGERVAQSHTNLFVLWLTLFHLVAMWPILPAQFDKNIGHTFEGKCLGTIVILFIPKHL